ncbi:hypothetical protein LR48_Vigan01g137400 [Vigna angularis]|uniref:Uncharacterized protein n=1 Tax=Phaseolus angularis TaxID=3914 RepID=A0A0L9TMK0_PHAAN|nr:hypothetical protein LR48_Vigan01g137400 [Vigna angularis]
MFPEMFNMILDGMLNVEEEKGVKLIGQLPWPINCWDMLCASSANDPITLFEGTKCGGSESVIPSIEEPDKKSVFMAVVDLIVSEVSQKLMSKDLELAQSSIHAAQLSFELKHLKGEKVALVVKVKEAKTSAEALQEKVTPLNERIVGLEVEVVRLDEGGYNFMVGRLAAYIARFEKVTRKATFSSGLELGQFDVDKDMFKHARVADVEGGL